jgi:hypothetical protein
MKWKIVLAVLLCTALLATSVQAQDEDPVVEDDTEKSDVANSEDDSYSYNDDAADEADTAAAPPEEPAAEEPAEQIDAVALDQSEDTVDVEGDTEDPKNSKAARKGKYSAYDDYAWAGIGEASETYNWNGESWFSR